MDKIIYEVYCLPKNSPTNFYYESFNTLDEAISFCAAHITGEDRYVNMQISEQIRDDSDPSVLIDDREYIHNKYICPYEKLGIDEDELDRQDKDARREIEEDRQAMNAFLEENPGGFSKWMKEKRKTDK